MRDYPKTQRFAQRKRWLVRGEGEDLGPYTTEEILAAIAARDMSLGTEIADVSDQDWGPVGTHGLFRDYYATCDERWQVEDAEEEAGEHARRLRLRRMVQSGTGGFMVVVVIVLLGFGGWITWRLLHAEPTGILEAVALADPVALPPAGPPPAASTAPFVVEPIKVPRVRDRESLDTRGVGTESEAGAVPVTTLDFDSEAGPELSDGQLDRIVQKARGGLEGCARSAVSRSAEFRGTRVRFAVRPGRIGRITVGKEASDDARFKACVRSVLKGIRVPSFGGADHFVTVPLRVR